MTNCVESGVVIKGLNRWGSKVVVAFPACGLGNLLQLRRFLILFPALGGRNNMSTSGPVAGFALDSRQTISEKISLRVRRMAEKAP